MTALDRVQLEPPREQRQDDTDGETAVHDPSRRPAPPGRGLHNFRPGGQAPRDRTRQRSAALDRIRGLAVLLMVADHVLMLWAPDAADPIRNSVTRSAMPLFALLAGHLVTRMTYRHAWILAVGSTVPVIPWMAPVDILVLLVVGMAVVVWRGALPLWLVVAVCLTAFGNGYQLVPGYGYEPAAVVGLVVLGAMLPRSAFAWGDRLPGWLAPAGRFPLTVYVGHLLLLHACVLAGLVPSLGGGR